MKAVHIRTEGLHDEYECAFVEMVVRLIEGVKDVACIRTMHLMSVLYDERTADPNEILETISRVGFRAYPFEQRDPQRQIVQV